MLKLDNIIQYKTSLSVFNKLMDDGKINYSDFCAIETALAEKYGISSTSIYKIKLGTKKKVR